MSADQNAYRSIEAAMVSQVCSDLTDINHHTEALLELASILPDCQLQVQQLRDIQMVQRKAKHLPEHLYNQRCEIANKLWKRARAYWVNDADYQLVRKGF